MGGGGTVQQWLSSPDDNLTCEEGSLKIQRLPPAGCGISPPERHRGSRASVDRYDTGHLEKKNFHGNYEMIYKEQIQ